ncbi:putative uncharacterized protein DDB_G0282133 isoform X1 [Vespa mandarinia]|uniref:putative uncharacterized protein DDB_G0282133 isoform X1 n=2 Tax=Vespa mandarinia TaxID=7446 RepID=UPI001616E073|nr:putative uncharacterized protein DDB_G0282133 isoform X1 [Vespa mandarinia]
MQEFCPLCDKRGFRRRIKALQINFHEAIWACEGEECEWPFGHADFIFIQRKVGNTWSCYWDDLNLKTMNNYVPVSTELTLYTPPETPSTDPVLKEFLTDHDGYCLKNNESENIDNKSQNVDIHVEDCEQDQTNDQPFYKNDKNNSYYENTNNIISIENVSKKILLRTEESNLKENIINSKYSCSANKMKNDLDNSVSKQIENNNDTSNISNINKSHNDVESPNSTLDQKLQINKFTEESTTPSNLKVTKVEIDGLPITVSYEAPISPLMPITVPKINANFITTECGNTSQSNDLNSSITTLNTIHKTTNKQLKSISVGKQYKKFDFHAIKRKSQPTVDNNDQSSDSKCLSNSNEDISNIKSSRSNLYSNIQIQKQNSPETIKPCPSLDVNDSAKAKVVPNESLENPTVEPEINVENLLNDLLKSDDTSIEVNKNYEISNNDEDWIHSLLY